MMKNGETPTRQMIIDLCLKRSNILKYLKEEWKDHNLSFSRHDQYQYLEALVAFAYYGFSSDVLWDADL